MFLSLKAIKDTYITNRVVNGTAQTNANVGSAGSLDLFKLYGNVTSSSIELSRLLIQFDLTKLRSAVATGQIDMNNQSFSCKMKLYDVYGGQPTPSNFTVNVFPLSASFNEGLGRDVVFYSDFDVCNWFTGSSSVPWLGSGCANSGSATSTCDYILSSSFIANTASLEATQTFITGLEDLYVDVTTIVSATVAGLLPDVGFRISFDAPLETNQNTYFVKRFASHTAYNSDLHPRLNVTFDDSIQDDTENMYLDSTNYMFLYNYVRSAPSNLTSGSQQITGKNCMLLGLTTPVSGGTYTVFFTGSQHTNGIYPVTGVYSSSVYVSSSDQTLLPQWKTSGSITFTPIWGSVDGTVAYLTGSTFKMFPPQRGSTTISPKKYDVSVIGLSDELNSNQQTILRVNIFDFSLPYDTSVSRLPIEMPGVVVRDVFYQIRDTDTNRVAIPFDTTTHSTRVSNDSSGMYFTLDASNLICARTYVIDILIITGNNQQLYKSASPAFRVVASN